MISHPLIDQSLQVDCRFTLGRAIVQMIPCPSQPPTLTHFMNQFTWTLLQQHTAVLISKVAMFVQLLAPNVYACVTC